MYLFERISEWGVHRKLEMLLPFTGSVPKWLQQQLCLDQLEARSLDLHVGLPSGWWGPSDLSISCCLPRHFIKKLDGKWRCEDFPLYSPIPICWWNKQWLTPMLHNASPVFTGMLQLMSSVVAFSLDLRALQSLWTLKCNNDFYLPYTNECLLSFATLCGLVAYLCGGQGTGATVFWQIAIFYSMHGHCEIWEAFLCF